jgi:hypothetical protein
MARKEHFSDVEKDTLVQIIAENGADNVLRFLGQIIAYETADVVAGDEVRSALCKIANRVQGLANRFGGREVDLS